MCVIGGNVQFVESLITVSEQDQSAMICVQFLFVAGTALEVDVTVPIELIDGNVTGMWVCYLSTKS